MMTTRGSQLVRRAAALAARVRGRIRNRRAADELPWADKQEQAAYRGSYRTNDKTQPYDQIGAGSISW